MSSVTNSQIMKNQFMFKMLVILLPGLTGAFSLNAQVSEKKDSLRKDALNVYLNCPYCDMDYVKKEITYINYVRDQKDAQLYILVTGMNTGSGGGEYSIFFIGQKEFKGKNDTLKFDVSPNDTDDEIREKGNQALKLGMMSYVAKTPIAKDINISYENVVGATEPDDPWKSWVFSINGNGYGSAQESIKNYYLYSYVDALKVTEKMRLNFTASYDFQKTKYKLDDTTTIVSLTNSKSINALYVGSLGDHWSAGGSVWVNSSTYSNIKFSSNFYPSVEYNLFKYAESTRRQLRFKYNIGIENDQYIDTTIFNKTKEILLMQSLTIAYKVIEKWGSISTSLYGSNYLHDFSKNSLSFNTSLDIRIFKGLSVNLYGYLQLIHDQLSLPKAGATAEEILTQQKQLATQYYYYASGGLTYTFGSIYNNVVNPRFGY